MVLDAYKELIPVVYGELSARFLTDFLRGPGQECFRLHWHERMEILRIQKGSMQVRVGEETLEAREGSLVMFFPCQPHYGVAGSRGVSYDVVMFDLGQLQNGTIASREYLAPVAAGDVFFPNMTDREDMVSLVDGLLKMYRDRENRNPLGITGAIYGLMGLLYEQFPPKVRAVCPAADSFKAVVEFVNANYAQPMSTADLSRRFGYNESYFCRRFKKITGLNCMRYIQILRLEHAQKLLRSGGKTLSAVAAESGFGDIYHFTHCFSRHFKISPDAYRKSVRGK